MKIKIIAGAEPHREGEYPWSYMVGCDGVTEIVEEDQNPARTESLGSS
ncbi:hypothetical protein HGG76_11905 [Ochrobactrum tritici]|uniref:Uncharacterized protein n=1 Tax=Brucella tritici TaxID=94626 RepID=A0A7X6JAL1_9HYPH|nr:hypothetical protein [Brucella tritici]